MTQPPPPVPPSAPPPGVGRPDLPGATAGMVLGIVSIVVTGFPIVGLVLGILAYQKSRDARALAAREPGRFNGEGMATAGYVCGIVGIVLGGINLLTWCCVGGFWVLAILGLAAEGAAAV